LLLHEEVGREARAESGRALRAGLLQGLLVQEGN